MRVKKLINRDECFGTAASILDSMLGRTISNEAMMAASALAQAYVALGNALDRGGTLSYTAESSASTFTEADPA